MSQGSHDHDHDHDHPHDHAHDHGHHHGHHHHGHSHSLPIAEEPLDPASQSLADALRSSFRILKLIMVVVVILFLFSGVFTVNNNEKVVLARFGRQLPGTYEPGLHFAFPYPIDSITRVRTGQRSIKIDKFWFNLSEADRTKDLSEVSYRTGGLDPATDGAIITGDQALMHVLLQVNYSVDDAKQYVANVSDESKLLMTTIQQAVVSSASRVTMETVWKSPSELAPEVQKRTQALLDVLKSGIRIDNLQIERSHYPLQVRDEFIAGLNAENQMRNALQTANKEREEKLKGAAGPAWEELYHKIERLDQLDGPEDTAQREKIRDEIGTILVERATGEAGRRIQLARGARTRVVNQAAAAASKFQTMLPAYKAAPELVKANQRQDMIEQVFADQTLSRWYVPASQSKFFLFNTSPDYFRLLESENIRKQVGVR